MRKVLLLFIAFAASSLLAQEASSGFDLHATVSALATDSTRLTQRPRSGDPVDAGFRTVLYPLWKLDEHWSVSGTFQLYSRPYFYESFSTQGHGLKGNLLQANVSYSKSWSNGSVVVRAGQLTTVFGSFLLRYDDADNPLIDLPKQYGYYYAPVSSLSVAGVQADIAHGHWDARAQFANSSPTNPRSIFVRDQYGNWAGGLGYTISQGFRVGVSTYQGPYLDRQYAYYFPGEAKPRDLPAHAYGVDAQWARGPWNLEGELQNFEMTYRAIPGFRESTGYAEVKRVLHPRWYIASRTGFSRTNATGRSQAVEAALGFRPNRYQLIKLGYEVEHFGTGERRVQRTVSIQFVTLLHPLSWARN